MQKLILKIEIYTKISKATGENIKWTLTLLRK
jgi:hypothetical protein